jgi:hypothetical protein
VRLLSFAITGLLIVCGGMNCAQVEAFDCDLSVHVELSESRLGCGIAAAVVSTIMQHEWAIFFDRGRTEVLAKILISLKLKVW